MFILHAIYYFNHCRQKNTISAQWFPLYAQVNTLQPTHQIFKKYNIYFVTKVIFYFGGITNVQQNVVFA